MENNKNYTLINGDSAEVLKNYPDNHFDSVVTSPPYNLQGLRNGHKMMDTIWKRANIIYTSYNDDLPEETYKEWQISLLDELFRVTKEGGSLFYNHKIRMWNRKGSHPMEWLLKTKWQFYQEIVWDRSNTLTMDKRMLFVTTERVYWLSKGKPTVFKDRAEHKKDVWKIAPSQDKEHPASYPVALARNCIQLSTPPNGHVLDPFNGSGSTGIAAVQEGMRYTGIDIDPNYIEIAERRIEAWSQMDHKKPKKLKQGKTGPEDGIKRMTFNQSEPAKYRDRPNKPIKKAANGFPSDLFE